MMGKKEAATPLLTKSEEENNNNNNAVARVAPLESAFCQELKRVGSMAAPMVAVTVSQYLLQVVSLMMVGHLGILVSFSGVAIATSLAEVTGFSVLLGMAGALETLCGQTYGAEELYQGTVDGNSIRVLPTSNYTGNCNSINRLPERGNKSRGENS